MVANGARRDIPSQVTGVAASDTSCVQICLAWADPDNEDGINVFRDEEQDPIATLPANTTTYCDQAATPGSHTYYVVAGNICGPADASDEVTGTRVPGVGQVLGLAVEVTCDDVCLSWTDLPNEDGYRIFRGIVEIGTNNADDVTFCDNTGVPGLPYTYTVQAFNQCAVRKLP
jgi:hypothetical protein